MALSAGLLETYMKTFELHKQEVLDQKAAFDLLDIDKSESITFQELKAMNDKFEKCFSEKELREQFKELDIDGNGKVSFPEFLKVYVKGEYGRDVTLPHIEGDHFPDDLKVPTLNRSSSRGRQPTLTTLPESDASTIDMRISKKNSSKFYCRLAEKFFEGSEERVPVELLRIRALGEAIALGVNVANELEKSGKGSIAKLQTDYPDMEKAGHVAMICIDVRRAGVAPDA
mmetsp:Transcript_56569/g.104707  ORF Transcript_56569/g.104707 Transcript_56569/m.104707 type:complete len:229 (-) Transcript_56569:21-707(-)